MSLENLPSLIAKKGQCKVGIIKTVFCTRLCRELSRVIFVKCLGLDLVVKCRA